MFYIIQDKNTKAWMPMASKGMGNSFVTPVEITDPNRGKYLPRLFKSKRAAQSFLSQWLRGEHRVATTYIANTEWNLGVEPSDIIVITKIPERLNYNLEIIPVEIVPVDQG